MTASSMSSTAGREQRKARVAMLALTLCLVSAISALNERAEAVPGLSSSNNVKEVVKMLRNYSGTNAANIYQIEQDLRRHPSESAEALVNVLDTNDVDLKKHASQLLLRLSNYGQDFALSDASTKTIIGILKASDDSEVQSNLVQVLGNLGPKNDSVKQAIVDMIKGSREVSVRRSAVDSLAKLAREERPALHAVSTATLVDVLKNDECPSVRGAAAGALGAYRDNPSVAVPALIQALDDNYLQVRTRVVQALQQYGADAKPAVPKLAEMVRSESDANMRSYSMQALKTIDPENPDCLKALMAMLDNPAAQTYQLALSQMYNLGPKGAPLVPKLIEILKAGQRINRQYAARALGSIGPQASAAIPALTAASAEDSDSMVRHAASQALRQIQTQSTASGPQ